MRVFAQFLLTICLRNPLSDSTTDPGAQLDQRHIQRNKNANFYGFVLWFGLRFPTGNEGEGNKED
jgi:hypothetical protein